MQIIPVIDLKDGLVVHAKRGNRQHYQPIRSKICHSADFFAVLHAFRHHYKVRTVYVADLNAITRQGKSHTQLIEQALTQFPEINFWVDGGFSPKQIEKNANFWPVVGSELLQEQDLVELKLLAPESYILSLDFASQDKLGPLALFNNPSYWPKQVIVMTLSQVGSGLGPNFELLKHYIYSYPGCLFIAAGGVRDESDLIALEQLGVNQVLVATALHEGCISWSN